MSGDENVELQGNHEACLDDVPENDSDSNVLFLTYTILLLLAYVVEDLIYGMSAMLSLDSSPAPPPSSSLTFVNHEPLSTLLSSAR